MPHYAKRHDHRTCLVSTNGEHTLCGDHFQGDDFDDGLQWVTTQKGPVTCPDCIREILNCRGVKIRLDNS